MWKIPQPRRLAPRIEIPETPQHLGLRRNARRRASSNPPAAPVGFSSETGSLKSEPDKRSPPCPSAMHLCACGSLLDRAIERSPGVRLDDRATGVCSAEDVMSGKRTGTSKAPREQRVSGSDAGSPDDHPTSVSPSIQIGIGVLLVSAAGYVDAIGYIALGGSFASFMSGASISLGVGVSEGDWGAVYHGAFLITAFLAGAIGATVLAGVAGVWALPIVLLLEGGLLAGAVLLAWTGWSASVSIFPVVTAMGVQNTALRPMDGVRLGVTYMTGTLVNLGQGVGRAGPCSGAAGH